MPLLNRCRVALALLALAAFAWPASAQVTWSGPKQTPAELAAVLRDCTACLANAANWPAPLPEGPTVFVMGSRPGALTWLDFPAPSPRYRLDGTRLDRPATVYGLPSWWVVGQNRPLFDGRRDHEHRGIAPVHRR